MRVVDAAQYCIDEEDITETGKIEHMIAVTFLQEPSCTNQGLHHYPLFHLPAPYICHQRLACKSYF